MKCIAEEIIDKMIESKNKDSSLTLDELVLFILDGISSYSERIDDLIYYTFKDDSLLGIKETTGEVRYKPWSNQHNNMIEVHDFLLDSSLENSNEIDEEFCTLDVDISEKDKEFLILSFLRNTLDEECLIHLETGINDIKLYHAILSNELKLLTTTFDHPDDLILHFLQKHVSPCSFSLYREEYELHSQLSKLLLNEQIVILLTNYVNSNKEVN